MPRSTPDTAAPVAQRASSFTPEQLDALRNIIREECWRRDRNALLKLLGYLTCLKVAGSLLLLVTVLLLRWLVK
ncbi:hypothetical protein PO498_15530 [Klebsiella variicola]|uniref:hypothetical protein n=1 Tax=Klebsiella variicola TaxID=244366 RepID=UPI000D6FD621|nr:hypothetical protein [Klebsiella variicola]MBY5172759.1 hypothetical protein [Klebsiella variicola]